MSKISKQINLLLISTFITIVGTILLAFGSICSPLVIVSMIMLLVAAILNLIATIKLRTEGTPFMAAFICLLVELAVVVTSVVLNFVLAADVYAKTSSILSAVDSCLGTIIDILIIWGITSACNAAGAIDVAKFGNRILWIFLIVKLISIVINILGEFPNIATSSVALVLAIVAAVLEVVSFIFYLILLVKSKKALA